MRSVLAFSIFALLLFAGCLNFGTPEVKPVTPTQQKVCRTVSDLSPSVKEECSTVSFTEPVCGVRKLPYSSNLLPVIHLCINDGDCVGKPLGTCASCKQAMSRCMMTIKNEDQLNQGTWKVGGNFTLPAGAFVKDPISITIPPNSSAVFDFYQIYWLDRPINSAVCSLYILEEPTVNDCVQVAKSRVDCRNVTTMVTTTREVCE